MSVLPRYTPNVRYAPFVPRPVTTRGYDHGAHAWGTRAVTTCFENTRGYARLRHFTFLMVMGLDIPALPVYYKSMDFNEFTQECVAYLRTHPEQRWGQAVFNTLATVRPDLADMIRGTHYDPFYSEAGSDIRPMWNVLRSAW